MLVDDHLMSSLPLQFILLQKLVPFVAHQQFVALLSKVCEVFGHIESVKILVILNPTGHMFISSGFTLFI